MALGWIADAVNAGARQKAVCDFIGIDRRTIQRWQSSLKDNGRTEDRRKESAQAHPRANKLSDSERSAIVDVCNQAEYQSLPPSQIVPELADKGIYLASESSFYRVLREVNQVNRRGRARPPCRTRPAPYIATAANQVWSWDITYLARDIAGMFFRLYLVMDIFSRKIVGWEVHESELAEHASQLIRKACLAESIHEPGLVLHADNGGPMKGATMLATLQMLGVVPSFSRPSVSDDNPYSESLFRTLKYTPAYPAKPFADLTAARKWVHEFVRWYNTRHHHSAIGYVTPAERHSGLDKSILENRQRVYEAAKANNPSRWSGETRSWTRITEVWLNPEKGHQAEKRQSIASA